MQILAVNCIQYTWQSYKSFSMLTFNFYTYLLAEQQQFVDWQQS